MHQVSALAVVLLVMLLPGAGAQVPATLRDFHVSGTQVGDADPSAFLPPENCAACHRVGGEAGSPTPSWAGSKMALAGRNPLFFAQMATANQDVDKVGYYCLRCHVPKSIVTGSALVPDGSALGAADRDGVDCHFCHAQVDPEYKPGISPERDLQVLAALDSVPQHFANAMFVLDPDGVRRGPRADAEPLHELETSPFHRSSAMCGTCHDVGNVAVSKQPDGSYRYNALDTPVDDENPWMQFPLERTYTEWKLSSFADGGVDMGGRFGGEGMTVVSTCQDCHMPRRPGRAAASGPHREDLRSHEFSGAAVWALDMIARYWEGDAEVDPAAIADARARGVDMLSRAVSLDLTQIGGALRVRIHNESGHKLPTGHIEGRRAWVRARFFDRNQQLLGEDGGYDFEGAHLDDARTVVYEMVVGLSDDAAAATGMTPGPTGHMALADTIVKDTRIPPRGFDRAAFENGGAPTVGRVYADGQYWDDVHFWLPPGTSRVEVTAFYQTVTRHYIEELRDNNVTDSWGDILFTLWEETGRGPPVPMQDSALDLQPFVRGDFNADGVLGAADSASMLACFNAPQEAAGPCLAGDFDGDRVITCTDLRAFAAGWRGAGPPPLPSVCKLGLTPVTVPGWAPLSGLLLVLLILLPGCAAVLRRQSGAD